MRVAGTFRPRYGSAPAARRRAPAVAATAARTLTPTAPPPGGRCLRPPDGLPPRGLVSAAQPFARKAAAPAPVSNTAVPVRGRAAPESERRLLPADGRGTGAPQRLRPCRRGPSFCGRPPSRPAPSVPPSPPPRRHCVGLGREETPASSGTSSRPRGGGGRGLGRGRGRWRGGKWRPGRAEGGRELRHEAAARPAAQRLPGQHPSAGGLLLALLALAALHEAVPGLR